MTDSHHGPAVAIPDALRASVLERIRHLDPRGRTVLFAAAVVGRYFDIAVLAAIVARGSADIRASLEAARALQLVDPDDADAERFVFRHALTRDIVYGELLASRTRPLHRRIARALEKDAHAAIEDVAYHWWAAGDRRHGVRVNEIAGDRAAAVHAAGVALVYYGRARSLVDAGSPSDARLTEKIRLMQAP